MTTECDCGCGGAPDGPTSPDLLDPNTPVTADRVWAEARQIG